MIIIIVNSAEKHYLTLKFYNTMDDGPTRFIRRKPGYTPFLLFHFTLFVLAFQPS